VAVTIAVATMTADATTVDSISDAAITMDATIIGKMAAAFTATRVTAVSRCLRSSDRRRPESADELILRFGTVLPRYFALG
jgi:hypothetical protein